MNDKFPKIDKLSNGIPRIPYTDDAPFVDPMMDAKDAARERVNRVRDMDKITVYPARPEVDLFSSNMRKRVVVYVRVSTDGLSQTTSFELQKAFYLDYVRQQPSWKLVGMYSDEGLTATSTKRRVGLLTMLNDAKAGKFDIIVTKTLSRLSRNLMDCMDIIYKLRRLPNPVGIYFESERLFTLDRNVDFTLQILSLIAQEESHKKSEAMNASYYQRYYRGEFTKPDLLGYDSIGVNEICVNVEEARTVQLMYMMFLAGISCKMIAEVLTMLGRKTHTHKCKNGKVNEGQIHWTADSVKHYLQNERRAGYVIAPKTYTPNYLDHESKKIMNNEKVQYYAVDQHVGIVSPEDYGVTQRLLRASDGGWKTSLPAIEVLTNTPIQGFVSITPNWVGFSSEDYNRASLKAYGVDEQDLESLHQRIAKRDTQKEAQFYDAINQRAKEEDDSFQHQYEIDSDDYERFPDTEAQVKTIENDASESFLRLVKQKKSCKDQEEEPIIIGSYDLSGCEIIRPQLFNCRDKANFTMDKSGLLFNSQCRTRLEAKTGKKVEYVSFTYNPVENLLCVHPEETESVTTLRWSKDKDDTFAMRRCTAKSLASSVYCNMDWNTNFKYKILGSVVTDYDGSPAIMFYLNEPIINTSLKQKDPEVDNEKETQKRGKQSKKVIIRDGYEVEDGYSFNDFSDTVEPSQDIETARSRATYYHDLEEKLSENITVEKMGNDKYNPVYIRNMMVHHLRPVEGWRYLRGMAVIRKNSLQIFPSEWADNFGDRVGKNQNGRVLRLLESDKGARTHAVQKVRYGWTTHLDLPTIETVSRTIEAFKSEMEQATV